MLLVLGLFVGMAAVILAATALTRPAASGGRVSPAELDALVGEMRRMQRDLGSLAKLAGDEEDAYAWEIAGESHYQEHLEALCGGRKPGGHALEVTGLLVREPENPHDANAIRVEIDGGTVGYIPRDDAEDFAEMLDEMPLAVISVRAKIVGGWEDARGQGHFGVRLDIAVPLELAAI